LNQAEFALESSSASPPSAGPLRARALLAGFRRPWLKRLPPSARAETLALLGDSQRVPLSKLDWVVAGLAEQGAVEASVIASAWRARQISDAPELRAFLAIYAFAALTAEERRESLRLVDEVSVQWRVGILVLLARAAHAAGDDQSTAAAARSLLGLVGMAALAIPAAIGLLQLARADVLKPKDAWRGKVVDALPPTLKADGRVAREIDLAR